MNEMNWESVWNVLKWILAVLAAGFVGHFGRVLAERIIARRGRMRKGMDAGPYDSRPEEKRIKAQLKIEKKRAKAEVKRKKKEE